MSNKEHVYSVKCGTSRRKVETINMSVGEPYCKGDDNDWIVECSISGFFSDAKAVQGRSHFDCLVCGMAYLRQMLRLYKSQSSNMKFYFEFDGELDELTIEDIFMTHDCITNEMEEMMDWAKKHGFQPE